MVQAAYVDNVASEIDDGLWQGGFPKSLASVSEAGFGVLVLCAAELQLEPATLERVAPLGVDIVQTPLDDVEMLTADDVVSARAAAERVVRALRAGKSVLTTCVAGRNRSGLVNGLALVKWRGISGAEAVQRIQARRADALTNETFCTFLEAIPAPRRRARTR